jgi:hypothetical protein
MAHKHKQRKDAEKRYFGWSRCVGNGTDCGGAHGGVTIVEECACGAIRRTESNGRHESTLGWWTPEGEENA